MPATAAAPGRPVFRVLYVCTGNLCRSPMAQSITTLRLAEALGADADRFSVTSAGTQPVVGAEMAPGAQRALAAHGVPALATRARALEHAQVAEADLILTAAREHRAVVARLLPLATRRCFTIVDFDRLTRQVDPTDLPDHDPVDRAARLVVRVGGLRGTLPPLHPAKVDLPDPYGRPDDHFDACVRSLLQLTAYWPTLLAGQPSA
ncbi:MAG: protein-tyrosine-phosphatase [Actinomycetota bacterium]